ncbi:hypothetical protein ACH4L5_11505 [Streptomyces sp. NPDC017405]|uniref:hypothetical protein n=1 Tax=unclassified Streptomyces TaxID=2593676 RepID=UPI00379C8A4D
MTTIRKALVGERAMSARISAAPVLRGEARIRRAEAAQWLLRAADSPSAAAMEWQRHGVAVLTAGRQWDAVRAPYSAIGREFGRDTSPEVLRRRLTELGVAGAVFCDSHRPHVYFLVPPGTDRHWPADAGEAQCLGGTPPYVRLVAVPRLDIVSLPGVFWLTPPDTGEPRLVDPEHLVQVLHASAAEPTGTAGPAQLHEDPRTATPVRDRVQDSGSPR